jgi:hypothetical protein
VVALRAVIGGRCQADDNARLAETALRMLDVCSEYGVE